MSWNRGPNTMAALKSDVAGEIAKHPTGVSRRAIFRRFNVGDPALEENRGKVWRLVAALAGLGRDGDVMSDSFGGERWYYARRSA